MKAGRSTGRPDLPRPPSPAAALLARLHDRRHVLAARLHAAVAAESGPYRAVLAGEIDRMIEHNLPIVLRRLADRSRYSEQDLQPVRDSAARVAAADVPQKVLLSALSVAVAAMLDFVWQEARGRERAALLGVVTHGLTLAKVLTAAITESYDEHRPRDGRSAEVAARRSLVRALLAGTPAEAAAGRARTALAPGYAVVLLPPRPGAPAGWPELLDRHVAEAFPPGTLTLHTADGSTFLVPDRAGEAPFDVGPVRAAVRALAGRTETPPAAAAAWRPEPSRLPEAAGEAREVLDIVTRLGRGPGLYVLDDVLLEWVLVGAADARRRLGAVLGPVDGNPGLLASLEAYLEADGDRRRAAARLHIHPTTLDYRLRQIAVRTGLSPARLGELMTLQLAVVARRLDGAEPAPPRAG